MRRTAGGESARDIYVSSYFVSRVKVLLAACDGNLCDYKEIRWSDRLRHRSLMFCDAFLQVFPHLCKFTVLCESCLSSTFYVLLSSVSEEFLFSLDL